MIGIDTNVLVRFPVDDPHRAAGYSHTITFDRAAKTVPGMELLA